MDDARIVDDRDIVTFSAPQYRAILLADIREDFYGYSEAYDLDVSDVRDAIAWCHDKYQQISEPHRLELYAIMPISQVPLAAPHTERDEKVALFLTAWNRNVTVESDEAGQVSAISVAEG